MLVQDGLQRNTRLRPDKTALICGGQRLTYASVDAMANRLANALVAHGVKRGDRVVIYLRTSVEAVAAVYGILRAGATFVIVNRSTKFEKLAYILANCRAFGLIAEWGLVRDGTVAKLRARCPHLGLAVHMGEQEVSSDGAGAALAFDAIQQEFPATQPRIGTIDLDLACLVYTSGSTGDPKGVMCGHSNVVFAVESITRYLENTADDIVINVLPLAFDYGLYQMLMTFTFGGTLVLESSFAFPVEILRRIEQERVTGLPGVPTVFAQLLATDLAAYDLSSLRYLSNTAAALPPSHIEALRRKFPGTTLYSMYGLTETKRTLYLPPAELERRPGSVGIAIPGTEVWVEGEDGRRLGPNEIGELVVRGRHVMRGYWEAPEATRERFQPGPIPGESICRTGDLFRMDQEGFLYFVGRKDDIIKTRGEKVSPREVENVLHSLPGVVEAAVFGVPDEILGEAVMAVLVADTSRVTKKDVLAHCRAQLEDFMIPKHVEFREELPKTASGKVYKKALRADSTCAA